MRITKNSAVAISVILLILCGVGLWWVKRPPPANEHAAAIEKVAARAILVDQASTMSDIRTPRLRPVMTMADDLSGPAPPSNDAIAPQQLTRTLAEAFPHGSSEWLTRLHSRLMSTMGSPLAHGGKQKFWGVHSITHPSIEVADDTATVESAAYIWALTLDGAPMTGHAQRVAQSMTQYTTTLTRVGDAWHVTNQTSRGS